HRFADGSNYVPMNKWVLFGHHFAAISGAGPLIGPVLAAQFGFLPGLLWITLGVVFAGATHDFIILAWSVRRGGRSLADMARGEISPVAGATAMVAILFIVVIALAGLGIAVVNALAESPGGVSTILVAPPIHAPALSAFVHGGGPIVPGKLYPFVFITIACGAISGFHSLVSSGTTPKMIDKETDARMIGYGAMLCEGLVGVVALIAVCALHPGDYYAINVPPALYATLGLSPVHLAELSREVGENVSGRTGGAVSLAVGFAQIFSGLPALRGLMSYWYHFAIMFEALFILTTIDAGTRVARFMVQEFMGGIWKPLER